MIKVFVGNIDSSRRSYRTRLFLFLIFVWILLKHYYFILQILKIEMPRVRFFNLLSLLCGPVLRNIQGKSMVRLKMHFTLSVTKR